MHSNFVKIITSFGGKIKFASEKLPGILFICHLPWCNFRGTMVFTLIATLGISLVNVGKTDETTSHKFSKGQNIFLTQEKKNKTYQVHIHTCISFVKASYLGKKIIVKNWCYCYR